MPDSSPTKYDSGEVKVLYYKASSFSRSYKMFRTEVLKSNTFLTEKTIGSGKNAVTILTIIPK